MDLGLLIIFVVGGAWLYAAALLALADLRWNFPRVAAFTLLTALCAWLAATGRTGEPSVIAVGVLLGLTMFLPRVAGNQARDLVLAGKTRAARPWEAVNALLSFRSPSESLRRLEEASRLLRMGWPGLDASGRARWFTHFQNAWSRRSFVTVWIEGLLNVREHERAVQVFEREIVAPRHRPDVLLLYHMTVAYAKSGKLRRALDCLRRADAMNSTGGMEYYRSVALLHLYAYAGRPHAVEQLASRSPALRVMMPKAYVALWRGVALMQRGEPEAAEAELASAIMLAPPSDAQFPGVVERFRTMLANGRTARLDPGLEAELDALESEEPAHPAVPAIPLAVRPIVTLGIIIACVALWLWVSSLSPHSGLWRPGNVLLDADVLSLIRFGANVSGMVRAGEWWRLVASIFLHAGMLHLALNMWACYILGSFVERFSGRLAVFIVFLVSGIAGSAVSAYLGEHSVSVGASGGVFGLLGACIVLTLAMPRIPSEARRMQLFTFLFFAAINAVYGLIEPRVDNLAHAGGLAGGLLMGLLVRPGSSGAWRGYLQRILGPPLCLLLAATALQAMASIRSGGYPRHITTWQTYTDTEGRWALEMPSSWRVVQESPTQTTFVDPLGMGFGVVTMPESKLVLRPASNERWADRPRIIRNGESQIQEMVLRAQEKEGRVGRFKFGIVGKRRSIILVLDCEEDLMREYRGLAERMAVGFRILNDDGGGASEAAASSPPATAPQPQ